MQLRNQNNLGEMKLMMSHMRRCGITGVESPGISDNLAQTFQ